MDNAALLMRELFPHQSGCRLLFHRGDFREWVRTHWAVLEPDDIESRIWTFLHGAQYRDDSGRLSPFYPNSRNVRETIAGLKALVFTPESVRMPSWRQEIPIRPEDILPMANGLLWIPRRILLPPQPGFLNGHALPYAYVPESARPSRWLALLDELWPDDLESQGLLQEVVGLFLTTDSSFQRLFLLVGPPRSGKGTIVRVIRGLVGENNVAAPTLASLATPFGLQPLIDRPVAVIGDARLSARTDPSVVVERLLSISGEDSITIDRKYKPAWTGNLTTRFLIVSNELPRLPDASAAVIGRLVVLETRRSFYGREDRELIGKLLDERSGILLWALEGLDRLLQRGHFIQPASSKQLIGELFDLSSPISAFLRERCDVHPSFTVAAADLFTAWRSWCTETNIIGAGTIQMFGKNLRAAMPDLKVTAPRVDGLQVRSYGGVRLKISALDSDAQ
jgi:putative DNA primase/helicase